MDGLEVGTKYPAMWSLTPDDGSASVPGLFWIEPEDGEIRATAHRSFDNRTSPFLVDRSPQLPMLYGDVMGRRVTLISCALDSSTGSLTGAMTDSLYSAKRAIIGNVWPAVGSEHTFDEVKVVFWDQDAWADLPRIGTQFDHGGPFVFTNPRIEPAILLSSTAEVCLEDDFSFASTDQDGYVLTPGSVFGLKLPEAQSYADLKTNWLMPLQFMILFSTSRRTESGRSTCATRPGNRVGEASLSGLRSVSNSRYAPRSQSARPLSCIVDKTLRKKTSRG